MSIDSLAQLPPLAQLPLLAQLPPHEGRGDRAFPSTLHPRQHPPDSPDAFVAKMKKKSVVGQACDDTQLCCASSGVGVFKYECLEGMCASLLWPDVGCGTGSTAGGWCTSKGEAGVCVDNSCKPGLWCATTGATDCLTAGRQGTCINEICTPLPPHEPNDPFSARRRLLLSAPRPVAPAMQQHPEQIYDPVDFAPPQNLMIQQHPEQIICDPVDFAPPQHLKFLVGIVGVALISSFCLVSLASLFSLARRWRDARGGGMRRGAVSGRQPDAPSAGDQDVRGAAAQRRAPLRPRTSQSLSLASFRSSS